MITKYTSVNFVSNDFLARIAILRLSSAIPGLGNALHGLGIALPEPCSTISPLSIAIQSAKRAVPDAKSRIAEGDFVSFLSKFAFSSGKWRRRVGCK